MDIYLLLTIIITSGIQSLFGVGVLLFGTPLLLLLDYSFFESLMILLPISASINLLQIFKDYKYIEFSIYKNILIYTVPFIIIFLYLIATLNIDITLFIGLFLIIISLKQYSTIIKESINNLLKYNRFFYISMGIIHGITNLGGALLTAKIFHTDLNKYEKRATIAMSYMTFAVFQIITIVILTNLYNFAYLIYVVLGVSIYLLVNKMFFHKITNNNYDKIFAVFLLITGIMLLYKGLQ
jgi:hypothetical protein